MASVFRVTVKWLKKRAKAGTPSIHVGVDPNEFGKLKLSFSSFSIPLEMNFLAFTLSLLVTCCLVAESNVKSPLDPDLEPIKEVESLQTIIVKRYPEKTLKHLVSIKGWEKDLAWAFSLGLALGKQQKIAHVQANKIDYIKVKISTKDLIDQISNWKCAKEDQTSFNSISELFDVSALLQMLHESDENEVTFLKCQILFSNCSLHLNSMIALDLAILQWLVHAIKAKPQDSVIGILPSTMLPICALSMHPQIGQHCTNEVHLVLSQFGKWIFSDNCGIWYNSAFATLLAILKVHDEDSKVWQKASEIAARMYPKIGNSCRKSRVILGSNHVFVRSMEERFLTPEKLKVCIANVSSQLQYDRKVHSAKDDPFTRIASPTFMIAKIEGNTLEWEGVSPRFRWYIKFSDQPGTEPKKTRLFICCRFSPPVSFWAKVTSWTNMEEFYKILKTSIMRRMILTYGMTILESSSLFEFSQEGKDDAKFS